MPFESWDLVKKSPDIVLACCNETPPNSLVVYESSINIFSVLKGTNRLGTSILRSTYRPRQGEYYLIFGNGSDGVCEAIEEYRIVPMGIGYGAVYSLTNAIAGKSLDEQLRILFKRRIADIGRHIKEEQGEKARLEELPVE